MKYIASLTLKLGARPVESPPAPSKPARRGGTVQSHMGRPGDTLVTPLKVAKKEKPGVKEKHEKNTGSGLPFPIPDFFLIFIAILVHNPAHGWI